MTSTILWEATKTLAENFGGDFLRCCYIYIISHSSSFISKKIFFIISEITLVFGKNFFSTANMFCDLEQVIYLARLLSNPTYNQGDDECLSFIVLN